MHTCTYIVYTAFPHSALLGDHPFFSFLHFFSHHIFCSLTYLVNTTNIWPVLGIGHSPISYIRFIYILYTFMYTLYIQLFLMRLAQRSAIPFLYFALLSHHYIFFPLYLYICITNSIQYFPTQPGSEIGLSIFTFHTFFSSI